MPETSRIEYKQKITDDLEKEVIVFLNSHEGGNIYIGIADDEQIVGIENSDTLQLKIKDLDMVEYLGSGIPGILRTYSRECFIYK